MTPARPDARTLIDTFLDPGTWLSWDEPPADPAAPGSGYAEELAAVRVKTRPVPCEPAPRNLKM